jgi:16S rRNA (uracil1498-N3)-methyltransferase
MQLFYFEINDPAQTLLELGKPDARHITKVLRKKTGDTFHVTDGKGNLFAATLGLITSNRCEIDLAFAKAEPTPSPKLHIAIAPTKMNDRMELFIEKCTEIGISRITPIICERSERRKINLERFQKIAVSAMQQSAQLWLPVIDEACTFHEFLVRENAEQKFMAHCMDGSELFLGNQLEIDRNTTILIGPEGDFSPQELEKAQHSNYKSITLGKNRLRTETAGIYSCTLFNVMNELS